MDVEGESTPVEEGSAVLGPGEADHRFTGYEGLSVLVPSPAGAARQQLADVPNYKGEYGFVSGRTA